MWQEAPGSCDKGLGLAPLPEQGCWGGKADFSTTRAGAAGGQREGSCGNPGHSENSLSWQHAVYSSPKAGLRELLVFRGRAARVATLYHFPTAALWALEKFVGDVARGKERQALALVALWLCLTLSPMHLFPAPPPVLCHLVEVPSSCRKQM